MQQELTRQGGVDRDDDGAEAAEPEPPPDEVKPAGEQHRDSITWFDTQSGQVPGELAGLTGRGAITQLALAQNVDENLTGTRALLLLQRDRQHPVRAILLRNHACQSTKRGRAAMACPDHTSVSTRWRGAPPRARWIVCRWAADGTIG